MKNMKFSVLMSVYYKENPKYLDQSLNSVFTQTVMPDEVVLVEDGKLTNELDLVISKYEKDYKGILKVVKYCTNRGLGKALHDGLLECSNEIVFRMDTDDICVKDRFEKTLIVFNKMDVDIVGGSIAEYDENMISITGYRIVPSNNNDIIKMMKKRNAMNHVTVAYKKSKVIKSGNYLDMPYFEDYYLWVRMLINNCVFYNLQENLVHVRAGNEMIQRRGGKNYIKCIINFEKAIYKLGFINYFNYILNVIERIIISIIPKSLRTNLYKNVLRKKEL